MGESHHLLRYKLAHRRIKKFLFYHVDNPYFVVVYAISISIYHDKTRIVKPNYLKREYFLKQHGLRRYTVTKHQRAISGQDEFIILN